MSVGTSRTPSWARLFLSRMLLGVHPNHVTHLAFSVGSFSMGYCGPGGGSRESHDSHAGRHTVQVRILYTPLLLSKERIEVFPSGSHDSLGLRSTACRGNGGAHANAYPASFDSLLRGESSTDKVQWRYYTFSDGTAEGGGKLIRTVLMNRVARGIGPYTRQDWRRLESRQSVYDERI